MVPHPTRIHLVRATSPPKHRRWEDVENTKTCTMETSQEDNSIAQQSGVEEITGDEIVNNCGSKEEVTSVEEEEKPRDEEGLLLEYDVVVCGTGLVQSILASSLARAGKSTLHIDGAGHYGELDAVWSLSAMPNTTKTDHSSSSALSSKAIPLSKAGATSSLKWHSEKKTTSFGIELGTQVQTPYGTGVVKSLPDDNSRKVEIELNQWKLANESSPVVYVGISDFDDAINSPIALEEYLFQSEGIRSLRSIQAEHLLQHQERYFALDATPAFVLAAGRAVEGMLASGVADYLEFKPVEGLYWWEDETLSRVPCSKNDVFGTKLLKAMDKRRLMKFIQLSMDYATQLSVAEELLRNGSQLSNTTVSAETEVQSLNERHLNQGRSLARPQNKAVATEELQVLQQCMEEQMSFDDFLSSKHKLSPKLRAIVRYALALETEETSTSLSTGMYSLRHHLQALGRFGTTAFLVPMYGSGELSQAFCRSAAVFGATYLLRRAPLGIEASEENRVSGVVIAGESQSEEEEGYYSNDASQKDKTVKCAQVVVPVTSLQKTPSSSSGYRILRRISILNGKLITSESGDQRHIIFLPPRSIGNSHAIQCVTLDGSVQVAPKDCTVLHLTTTVGTNDCDSILEKACQAILETQNPFGGIDEIYQVTFSHDISPIDAELRDSLPDGCHLCSHSGQVLTADTAFEQAKTIFSSICPGMEFLGLSDKLDAAVKERATERGYEDDERLMLESALGMIETTPTNEEEIVQSERPKEGEAKEEDSLKNDE